MSLFQQARRANRRLRVAFDGPSGSGKSYSGLRLAFAMLKAGLCSKICAIDTENDSLSLYAGESPDGEPWQFDVLNLKQFSPKQFTYSINEAVKAGYDCIFLDSLSHAWVGEGGALDQVDKKKSGGNSFTAWADITPMQREMVDTIIRCPAHVIATMRSKTEWVIEDGVNKSGQTVKVPRKLGMAPVQRDGLEYEFDVYGTLDWTHQLRITKSRCSPMQDQTADKPGPQFWAPLFDWLRGIDNTAPPPAPKPAQPANDGQEFTSLLSLIQNAGTKAELMAIGMRLKDDTAAFNENSVAALRVSFGQKLATFK